LLQGKQVEALKWLETAIRRGNENYRWFEVDSNWSAMHGDARFQELMNHIKSGKENSEGQSA
jgi:hypothetical protein